MFSFSSVQDDLETPDPVAVRRESVLKK